MSPLRRRRTRPTTRRPTTCGSGCWHPTPPTTHDSRWPTWLARRALRGSTSRTLPPPQRRSTARWAVPATCRASNSSRRPAQGDLQPSALHGNFTATYSRSSRDCRCARLLCRVTACADRCASPCSVNSRRPLSRSLSPRRSRGRSPCRICSRSPCRKRAALACDLDRQRAQQAATLPSEPQPRTVYSVYTNSLTSTTTTTESPLSSGSVDGLTQMTHRAAEGILCRKRGPE